jgi:hypothetical protein
VQVRPATATLLLRCSVIRCYLLCYGLQAPQHDLHLLLLVLLALLFSYSFIVC